MMSTFHVMNKIQSIPPCNYNRGRFGLLPSDTLVWSLSWKGAKGGSLFCRHSSLLIRVGARPLSFGDCEVWCLIQKWHQCQLQWNSGKVELLASSASCLWWWQQQQEWQEQHFLAVPLCEDFRHSMGTFSPKPISLSLPNDTTSYWTSINIFLVN